MASGLGKKNTVDGKKELEELNHLRVRFVGKLGLIRF